MIGAEWLKEDWVERRIVRADGVGGAEEPILAGRVVMAVVDMSGVGGCS